MAGEGHLGRQLSLTMMNVFKATMLVVCLLVQQVFTQSLQPSPQLVSQSVNSTLSVNASSAMSFIFNNTSSILLPSSDYVTPGLNITSSSGVTQEFNVTSMLATSNQLSTVSLISEVSSVYMQSTVEILQNSSFMSQILPNTLTPTSSVTESNQISETLSPYLSSPLSPSESVLNSSAVSLSSSYPLSSRYEIFSSVAATITPSSYSSQMPYISQTATSAVTSQTSKVTPTTTRQIHLTPTPTPDFVSSSEGLYSETTSTEDLTEARGVAANLTIVQWFLILVGAAVFIFIIFLMCHFLSAKKIYEEKSDDYFPNKVIEIDKIPPQSPKEKWRNSWALESMSYHIKLPKENGEEMEARCNPVYEEESSHLSNGIHEPNLTKL